MSRTTRPAAAGCKTVNPSISGRFAVVALSACLWLALAAGSASATPCTPAGADPAPANAPLPGSCFEAYDGDQADSDLAAGPRLDWAGVKGTAGFAAAPDFTIGAQDSQFGPGGSELTPDSWTFDVGTLGSDKYNVFSAWNYREPVPTSDLYLGLSFTRESNNGQTYLAFELNQKLPGYRSATESTSNRTIKVPTRSAGDLLITYDVDNNDLTPRLGVCVWAGDEHTGTWTDGNGTDVGASCPEVPASVIQASMNASPITAAANALSGVALQAGQFGEAAINLPAALRALSHSTVPTNPCVSFGYAWIHSRSSAAITSNQQDYILPSDPISVANCSVSGRKVDDLNGNGTVDGGETGLGGFTFFADYNDNGVKDSGEPFDVSAPRDASDLRPAGTYTITGLNPGSYPIREVGQAGWMCTAPSPCSYPITMAGQAVTGKDFLNFRPHSVSGIKYEDLNADGSRQQGEGGLAGFTFYIDQDANGYDASDPQAVSAADGSWTISGLAPGTYTVRELAKDGWTCSDPGNPCQRSVTVPTGQDVTGVLFGNYRTASVSGIKYEDLNADGSRQQGEGGLAGFTFYIDQDANGYDASDPQAVSAADGSWTIDGLKPGSYTVKELAKEGWTCSDPGNPCQRDITLTSGQAATGVLFANWHAGSISGSKYEDVNANGARDPGDPALSGLTFYVDQGDPGYQDSDPHAVSAADGSWTIDGVKPGSYTVKELAKEGWTCSDPGNPCQRDATVVSGADTAIAAFGNYRDATISGHKFADLDQNHQKGAGEPYLAGWTIYVDTNGNGALDDGEPSAVTDAGGAYSIGGLTPSDTPVQVREVQQPGWACTAPTTVDDHGCLYTLTLHSGDAKTADFGNFRSIGVTLDKTGPDLAHHGDTLNYLIKVSTQSEAPLSVVTVTDPKCADAPVLTGKTGGNGDALLEQGETWTYACSLTLPATHAAGDSPFVNTAFVDAQDELGRDVTSQDDQATRILHPAISLDKQVRLGTEGAYTDGPLEAYVGDLLGYRVAVTNTGDTALTLAWGADASSAAFVDDRCDPGTISGPLGDDGDGKLGVGETWSYTCTHRITAADPDPLTNTVKVTGTDQLGGPKGTVTDTDSTTTDIVHPAIAIDKTGPATATAGALITYTLDVTNPGDMSFADPLVVVADALCQAPPALQTKNGDGSPGTLDPGDRWTYTCQVQTQSGQTSVHNVGDVTGTDHNGHSVNATDDATTVLAQQAVSPVAVVSPGSAKLRGPVGCPTTRLVKASVTGKRIVRVTWYVDGRKVATRTKPDKKGRWTISLRLRSLRYGVHTVRAQVRFAADSQTKTKTMRLSFTRCRPAIVRPKFTG